MGRLDRSFNRTIVENLIRASDHHLSSQQPSQRGSCYDNLESGRGPRTILSCMSVGLGTWKTVIRVPSSVYQAPWEVESGKFLHTPTYNIIALVENLICPEILICRASSPHSGGLAWEPGVRQRPANYSYDRVVSWVLERLSSLWRDLHSSTIVLPFSPVKNVSIIEQCYCVAPSAGIQCLAAIDSFSDVCATVL